MIMLWTQRNRLVLLMLTLFLTATFIGVSQGRANAQVQPFLITPYFGTEVVSNPWSSGHGGIDFGTSYERVLAAADGSISHVAWYDNNNWCHQNPSDNNCGYGLHIYVQHGNGYVTRYAHLSAAAFGLGIIGTPVSSGQIIGTSGHTGHSTGPHLHFEVRDSNVVSVNPAGLWKDGQWANPSRPIPAPPDGSETIVDDILVNNSDFSKGSGGEFQNPCNNPCGGWSWVAAGYNGDRFYTAADGVGTINQWAKWQPTALPSYNGIYEVYVYVPDNNATSWQAPYKIVHADGTSTAVVDQYGLFNQWVSIGSYRMNANSYVSTYDATGENSNQHCSGWCQLGVDAIKFVRHATYAPDVRYGSGWTSTVTLRNNGGGYSRSNINFLNSSGTVVCQVIPHLWANQSNSYSCNNSGVVSAIVDGSQDLSVSIITQRSDRAYGGSGMNPGTTGDPAVEYTATTLYAPALYHNAWGYNSTIFVQNTGSTTANVTLYLIGRTGYPSNNCTFSINPGGRQVQTPIGCASSLPSPWVGSARIVSTNGQSLAVQVLGEKSSTADARSFMASTTGQTVLYLPAAYKNQWNTNSGVVVQNVGGGNSRIRLTFYDRNTGNQTTTYDFGGAYLLSGQAIGQWLPDLAVLPNGWVGSIKVESLDGQPLAAIAQVADANDIYEYTAATGTFGSTVVLPRASRYDGSKTTGFIVLNPGSSSVTVKRTYYNRDGSVKWTGPDISLSAHASAGYHQSTETSLGSGWTGSILLQANGPVVAVMREDDTSALSASAYNGLLR